MLKDKLRKIAQKYIRDGYDPGYEACGFIDDILEVMESGLPEEKRERKDDGEVYAELSDRCRKGWWGNGEG